jgi:hypothetical protein
MKWYKVFVNGRNFLLDAEGEIKKCGFYTTRWVEALGAQEAEEKAISMLVDEPRLRAAVMNEDFDRPTMHVESVEELDLPEDATPPTPGLALYVETDEDRHT